MQTQHHTTHENSVQPRTSLRSWKNSLTLNVVARQWTIALCVSILQMRVDYEYARTRRGV